MIRFEDVIVQIGDFQLTVNMTVPKGFTTVIGQSGAGKSTLLSLLSGHRELTSGKIFVDGTRVDLLPPFQRPCSTIFQEFNLFPHLTISQNLNLVCGKSFFVSDISREKIKRVLEKVGIVELIDRLPSEISGGQQSRAALARVLLQDNPILLLDEPPPGDDIARFTLEKKGQSLPLEVRFRSESWGLPWPPVTRLPS